MIYLRKFNEELRKLSLRIIRSKKPGDLFEEMEQTKFYADMKKNELLEFDDSEIAEMINILDSMEMSHTGKISGRCYAFTKNYKKLIEGDPSDFFNYLKRQRLLPIEIWKTSDEWYFVNLNYIKYIKCDQWDGLLQCLDQNVIPKK